MAKKRLILLFISGCLGLVGPLPAEPWGNTFEVPAQPGDSVPQGAPAPAFNGTLNVLSLVRIQEDLGRQQTLELDRLWRRSNKTLEVGVFSHDLYEDRWPRQLVEDFHLHKSLEVPIHFLSPPDLSGVFRGYDPTRVRILPQTLLFTADRRILSTLRGFHTAEQIEAAIESARLALAPAVRTPATGEVPNKILNGDFGNWTVEAPLVPESWTVSRARESTLLKADRDGINRTACVEIRSGSLNQPRQILFQLLRPLEDYTGKTLRLSASAQSNALGQARVVLAIPAPEEVPGERYIPDSPFTTTSGKPIPFRILAALDFEDGDSAWHDLAQEVKVPEDARALAALVYLENPKAREAAVRVDEVAVRVVGE